MLNLTLGSLFSGSGGFELAGIYAGMTPLWASEVESYPIAVTRARLPGMKHLGDVSKVSGAEVTPVDVITFGSPCQDMSIAGKRAGMQHTDKGDEETTRSGMFYEAIRIIREMREATHGEYPKYAVWENVPGAFSSAQGEDFRCVLEEFASVATGERISIPLPEKRKWLPAGEIVGDGFSIAWRVLDAQYWGVPQRRKRIYLVADFTGECAGKILFERDGLSGYSQSGEAAREGTADNAERSVGGSDRVECLNPWEAQSIRQYAVNGVWPALSANNGGGQNRSGVCHALDSMSSNSMKSSNPHSGFHEEAVTKTLQACGIDPTCNQGGNVIVEPVAAFMGGQGVKAGGIGYSEDVAPTIKSVLSGGNTVPDVVYALQGNGIDRADTAGCNGKGWREDICYTLNTIDRPAVVYEPKSVMEKNWDETDVKNALRANASKSSHVVVLNDQGGESITVGTDDLSPTLRAQSHQHEAVVCYDTTQITSPMNYSNPHCGDPCHPLAGQQHPPLAVIYDARGNGNGATVPTLTGDHQNRVTDYTSVCVEEQPIVSMEPSFFNTTENKALPLLAKRYKEPPAIAKAYGVDCRNAVLDEERTHTLQAKANGGQSLNCTHSVLQNGKPPRRYIVRRLTPLECCRLQGFPDDWADIDRKDDFTDAELEFWRNVRNTHATINSKQIKEYTKPQMLKWYNGLQTDSATYRMWGNGIALPCARFVLDGIALALEGEVAQ